VLLVGKLLARIKKESTYDSLMANQLELETLKSMLAKQLG